MNKDLVTVIYYTSNQEKEDFEQKIRTKLLETIGDLPLISVSQKPIDFGKNICVGDVGVSDYNVYRQIQIGCEAATTPFVIAAEADCLYPKDYFEFVPDDENQFYRYDNIWILYRRYNYYFKKSSSECAMMAGRKKYIEHIKRMLKYFPQWNPTPKDKLRWPFRPNSWQIYGTNSAPCINIKTGRSMRKFTRTISNTSDIDTLPYWGTVADLKKQLFNNT